MNANKIDQRNYQAIELLEQLGNDEPTQHQIDLTEKLLTCVGLSRGQKISFSLAKGNRMRCDFN